MTDAPVADPATRLLELAELVRYHNHRYHALDDPEISDGDSVTILPAVAGG